MIMLLLGSSIALIVWWVRLRHCLIDIVVDELKHCFDSVVYRLRHCFGGG